MTVQEELEYHPALLAFLCAILKQAYGVEIQYAVADATAYMGLGWNIPPRITNREVFDDEVL